MNIRQVDGNITIFDRLTKLKIAQSKYPKGAYIDTFDELASYSTLNLLKGLTVIISTKHECYFLSQTSIQ